ncbi:MAG TPA: hypothetical protein VIM42_11575 [Clostridium sp.]
MAKDVEIKSFNVGIVDAYDDSIIIKVNEWRMAVSLDLSVDELRYYQDNKASYKGRNINVEYVGDLEDVNTLSYLPIKTLD